MWKQILGLMARLSATRTMQEPSHQHMLQGEADTRQSQMAQARRNLVATLDAVDKASLRMWLDDKGDPFLVEQLESISRQLGSEVRVLETAPDAWWHLRAHHQARLGEAHQLLLLANAPQPN